MQLRVARLCLDCEDVHEGQQCPVCASETFAFLTRWVPAPERRNQPRAVTEAPRETLRPAPASPRETPRSAPPSKRKMVGYGMLGVGVVGLAEWFLRGRARIEKAAERSTTGELK